MKILFVCLGNICRSPTAEGVFRKLLSDQDETLGVEVDSAGTQAYHVGEPPDPRSQAAAARRGVDLSTQRARRVTSQDFESFDLVLAMDESNLAALLELCPQQFAHRVKLFLDFAQDTPLRAVPDPYYGGVNGFEQVLDIVELASRGLLTHVRRHAPRGGGAST